MEKQQKRIQQVVKHLLGTKLALHQAMNDMERDDSRFCCAVLKEIRQNPITHKWERHEPA